EDWQVDDLVEHLHSKGLRCRAVASMHNGPMKLGVFFTTTDLSWQDLNNLLVSARPLDSWKGTVQCRRVGYTDWGDNTIAMWGDAGERLGPFALFGDPALRAKIRELCSDALQDSGHSLY